MMSTESNQDNQIVKLKERWEIIYIDEKDGIHSVRLNNIKDILAHEYLSTKIKNKDKFHHLYKELHNLYFYLVLPFRE